MIQAPEKVKSDFRSYSLIDGEAVSLVSTNGLGSDDDLYRSSSAAFFERAYRVLYVAYVLIPLMAGVDKFFHQFANWPQYLAPEIPALFGLSIGEFLIGVGVFEIALAIAIAISPLYFANVLAVWFAAIIINVMLHGQHLDIAMRDFGLSAGACVLARLSRARAVEIEIRNSRRSEDL